LELEQAIQAAGGGVGRQGGEGEFMCGVTMGLLLGIIMVMLLLLLLLLLLLFVLLLVLTLPLRDRDRCSWCGIHACRSGCGRE